MPTLFKKKNRDGGFYPQWRFRYVNAEGKRVEGIGWTDAKKTRNHALDVESEARAIRTGQKAAPPAWLQNRNKSISEVVAAYLEWGRASGGKGGRPWSKHNGKDKGTYLEWWTEQLGLRTLADIDLARVEKSLRALTERGLAPKSVYLRMEALRSMCHWAIKRGFLSEHPLRGMASMNVRPKDPHRPLTEEETAKLLRVSCVEHRIWYETALETGYRVGELRSLRVRDFDRFGPSLPLGADYTKNRKDARQPITRELAAKLEILVDGKSSEEPLLGIPSSHGWKRIKADYVTAGILDSSEGRVTWHSLRKVYVNNLVRTGADLKTVMELARHSAASMTLDVYASSKPAMLRAAVESAAAHIRSVVDNPECGAGVARAVGESVSPIDITSNMVRATGVEPARPCGHQPLKLARLPIPPRAHGRISEANTCA